MNLLQQLNMIDEAKQSLGHAERSKQKKHDPEQETYFGKDGSLFDPANPYHQDEKKRREKEAKDRKAYIKNMKAAGFPKLPDGTRLFDRDLVDALRSEYGKAYWDNLDELEQIEHQIDFVSDMRDPAFRVNGADGKQDIRASNKKFDDWVKKTALKLQSQIKVPTKD